MNPTRLERLGAFIHTSVLARFESTLAVMLLHLPACSQVYHPYYWNVGGLHKEPHAKPQHG